MPRRPHSLHVAPLLAGLVLAACGSSGSGSELASPDYRLKTPPHYVAAQPLAIPTPGVERTMHAADATRLRAVLDGWATAIRHRRPAKATRYFALPAIVSQPVTGPVEIRTKAIAERFNDSFPCGTKLVSARPYGRYIVGTFQLVSVKGRICTTPKALVKVGFVFGDRRRPKQFTELWRFPDLPGVAPGPTERPAAPIAGPDSFR